MYLSIISALNVFALSLCAGIEFNPHAFIDNLPYMAKGMLGIFIVIGIIIAITSLLNVVTSGKKKKKDKSPPCKEARRADFLHFKILLRVILTSKIKHDTIKLKKILKCQISLIY